MTADQSAEPSLFSPAARAAIWLVRHYRWHVLPLGDGTTEWAKLPRGGCRDCRPGVADHTAVDCPCLASGQGSVLCHGVHAASNDIGVTAWRAAHYPRATWAVHLGRSGLIAIDADRHGGLPPANPLPGHEPMAEPPADGVAVLSWLAERVGNTSLEALTGETLAVETPTGGRHLIYRTAVEAWKGSSGGLRTDGTMSPQCLGWQIDVKAYGGFVLLPGNTTMRGQYRRISPGVEPAELPGWLVDELRRTGHDRHATPERRPYYPRDVPAVSAPAAAGISKPGEYAANALRSACDELAAMSPNSGRNRKTFRSASRLAGMVAAGWIDEHVVRDELATAARACGLPEGEVRYAIDSGFRSPRPAGGAA
jgi:hypothetical protein